MPKSPTSPSDARSPRSMNPYTRTRNNKSLDIRTDGPPDEDVDLYGMPIAKSPFLNTSTKSGGNESHHPHTGKTQLTISTDGTDSKIPTNFPKSLAIASTNVSDKNYWSLIGDFLRTGVHVFSKSGKHAVLNPLEKNLLKEPRWLQLQFNVVVKEESYWTCELMLKNMGNLMCGKDMLIAVQTGGQSIEKRKGKYTLALSPPPHDDGDPRIAISYFIEYHEKLYMQALDGSLSYSFILQRVSGKAEEKAKRNKKVWWK